MPYGQIMDTGMIFIDRKYKICGMQGANGANIPINLFLFLRIIYGLPKPHHDRT